jgi:cytochrome c oxidase assembly protein subunit 15
MAESANHSGLYRFSIVTLCSTILLLVAGALVTNNNAGDSVPDWPLAYGHLVPPMLVGGIRYEYAHRVVAGIVAVLTLFLAVWLARNAPNRLARRLGWTALGLVIAQGALGGARVLFHHPTLVATAHAILAQLFFVAVVSLSLFTSAWWQRNSASLQDASLPRLRPLAAWTTVAIFVQLILGAGFRHDAFGILPHLIGAVVVLFLAVWTSREVRKRFGQVRDLRRWGIYLQALLGTQILLGIAAYWAVVKAAHDVQPNVLFVLIAVVHVIVGALTLAASVLLMLSCFRLICPTEVLVESAQTEKSSLASRA